MKENKKVYIYSVKVKFQRKWQIFYASSVNDTTSLGVQDRYLHMRSNCYQGYILAFFEPVKRMIVKDLILQQSILCNFAFLHRVP